MVHETFMWEYNVKDSPPLRPILRQCLVVCVHNLNIDYKKVITIISKLSLFVIILSVTLFP